MNRAAIQLLTAGMVLTLSGCALFGPATDKGGLADLHKTTGNEPVRLAVLQATPDFHVERLGTISSKPVPDDMVKEQSQLKLVLALARAEVDKDMFQAVRESNSSLIIRPDAGFIGAAELEKDNAVILPETLAGFHAASGADALFRYRVVGYGGPPETYMHWYTAATVSWITAVTAIAYSNPTTRPFIGAYLLSEVLEEGMAAYVSYNGINSFLKPVTIEGELIDLRTGETLWTDSVTDYAWSALFDKAEDQLEISTDRTIRDLSMSLGQALNHK